MVNWNIRFKTDQCYLMARKFYVLAFIIIGFSLTLSAQNTKDEISAAINKSASTQYIYPEPDASVKQTPAPKGYKPFYISHYGRHGSRYLLKAQYEKPLQTLTLADQAGMLTSLGKEVKNRLVALCKVTDGRSADLTPLGVSQHRGIAERMYGNFPEVFRGNTVIDARSTPVVRCILSMSNECMRFKELNPNLQVFTDASARDLYYMDYNGKMNVPSSADDSISKAVKSEFDKKYAHPERLMKSLFTDDGYVKKAVKEQLLMTQLFEIAGNMQNIDANLSFYDLFRKEECYEQWLCSNVDWYLHFGSSPLSKGYMPFRQSNLLKNILNTTDSILARGKNAVTLRFGHDYCVLPLASLMELGNSGIAIDNLDELANKWQSYNIAPMAGNIQLIFFQKKNSKDILVKALLNEREVTLPIKSNDAPYYKWTDLEVYYRAKLASFEGLENASASK